MSCDNSTDNGSVYHVHVHQVHWSLILQFINVIFQQLETKYRNTTFDMCIFSECNMNIFGTTKNSNLQKVKQKSSTQFCCVRNRFLRGKILPPLTSLI